MANRALFPLIAGWLVLLMNAALVRADENFAVGRDLGMLLRWNHGLEAETADRAFKVRVGGRLQVDGSWIGTSETVMFGPGGIGRADDAVNFRRARLDVEATMWEQVDFYCQFDFVNTTGVPDGAGGRQVFNVPVPTDLWVTFTRLPVLGNLRVGNQKAPIGFEHLTSSKFLNFMERSLGFDAFLEDQNNGFRPGVQAFNWDAGERMTWAIGIFKNTRSPFGWNVGDGEYDVTGRVTYLPWYEADGRCLLHVGVGASYRDLDDHTAFFRSRIAIRNGPAALHNVVAAARMLGDSQLLLVPELALVHGPFTLQTEYMATWVSHATFPINPPVRQQDRGTAFYQGYYVEVLYFLTGEHRRYNRATGGDRRRIATFDRVVPHENFFLVDGQEGRLFGRGAWQVGLRYSYVDLVNKEIGNGLATSTSAVVHDWTLGLNWFLNPSAKIQWNYSVAVREALGRGSNGVIHAFGTRVGFDF